MNTNDIKTLADLSRLRLSDDEVTSYAKDFEGILDYINMLKEVPQTQTTGQSYNPVTNVMRKDDDSYVPGEFSEVLLHEAPQTQDGFVRVKKIL